MTIQKKHLSGFPGSFLSGCGRHCRACSRADRRRNHRRDDARLHRGRIERRHRHRPPNRDRRHAHAGHRLGWPLLRAVRSGGPLHRVGGARWLSAAGADRHRAGHRAERASSTSRSSVSTVHETGGRRGRRSRREHDFAANLGPHRRAPGEGTAAERAQLTTSCSR